MANFILQIVCLFAFPQQTEVLETVEKIISMKLHFPSTSGEESQLFLLPLPAGYTGPNETHLWQQQHWQDPVLLLLKSIHVLPWTINAAAPGFMITSQLCFQVKSSYTPSSQQFLGASSGSCKCVPGNSAKHEHLGL